MKKPHIALIGPGRWGKNLLREFNVITTIDLIVYHNDPETKQFLQTEYPHIPTATDLEAVWSNPKITAVVIATPINTHYQITKAALLADKDVFVEKPLCFKTSEARELAKLAKRKKRILMVGHIFLHHPVYQKIKTLLRNDPPTYIHTSWEKYGSFVEKIIPNLVSHEVSLLLDLWGSKPKKGTVLSSRGVKSKSDVIFIQFEYPQKRYAFISVNRASPNKKKMVSIRTAKHFYVWNDNDLYRLNDKTGELSLIYQSTTPPLTLECQEFVHLLGSRKQPRVSGDFAADVVQILEKLH